MEIVKIAKKHGDYNPTTKTAEIILKLTDEKDVRYVVQYFMKGNDLHASRGDMKNNVLQTYTPCWLKFDNVLNISYDELTLKSMSGELGNSLQELNIYYNLYLYLIGQITEQDLRNEIVKTI